MGAFLCAHISGKMHGGSCLLGSPLWRKTAQERCTWSMATKRCEPPRRVRGGEGDWYAASSAVSSTSKPKDGSSLVTWYQVMATDERPCV